MELTQTPPSKNEGLLAALALAHAAALVRDSIPPEEAIKMSARIFATTEMKLAIGREPAILTAIDWAIQYAQAKAINTEINATLLETAAKQLVRAYGGIRK